MTRRSERIFTCFHTDDDIQMTDLFSLLATSQQAERVSLTVKRSPA